MDKMPCNIEVMGEVRKGPISVLKVSVGEYMGRVYAYVQEWRKDEQDDGPGEETHLGLTLRPNVLRELIPLLQAALETATARKGERQGGDKP